MAWLCCPYKVRQVKELLDNWGPFTKCILDCKLIFFCGGNNPQMESNLCWKAFSPMTPSLAFLRLSESDLVRLHYVVYSLVWRQICGLPLLMLIQFFSRMHHLKPHFVHCGKFRFLAFWTLLHWDTFLQGFTVVPSVSKQSDEFKDILIFELRWKWYDHRPNTSMIVWYFRIFMMCVFVVPNTEMTCPRAGETKIQIAFCTDAGECCSSRCVTIVTQLTEKCIRMNCA